MPLSFSTWFSAYSGVVPLPVEKSVLPLRSATEWTVSPASTTYRTPSVLTAETWTPPFSLFQSTLARLQGISAMSSSPLAISGTISSAVPATVNW